MEIKIGSSNVELIKVIQQKLGVKVDGDFGKNTKSAVESFQQNNSLPVTGIVDEETAEKLGVELFVKILKVDKVGRELIQKYEGCKLTAYPDPATGGIPWTIGFGNTYYEDGTKVKKGDKITQQRADDLLLNLLVHYEKGVDSLTRDDVSQNQFNALVSFAWNVGIANLKSSTLLKKVNINPEDKTIRAEFEKWNRANGKVMAGLVARRNAEADLYFKK